MKKFILPGIICMLLSIGLVNAQTEAEMKAWQTYMTPGNMHTMLADGVGDWTEEITFWMDPNAAPTKTTTNSKGEMIMGGRYLVSKTSGEMMGMPFEGMSIIGYDNSKKVFTSTWVDNMGTGTITMEGAWDDATKSVNFKGKGVNPMNGKDVEMRQVMKIIDKDNQAFEMYDNKTGKEVKTMEIKSTRKK